MLKYALPLLSLLALPLAQAHDYQLADLHIDHPWSRAMPPNAPAGAAYFLVENRGNSADRLVAVSTPRAGKSELHNHVHENGLMKMVHVSAVDVAAGAQVEFSPGGYHVMLFQLNQPLQAGDRFPLTLQFEKAGSIEVEVQVQEGSSAAHH
jgi:copper(I)-binding protein